MVRKQYQKIIDVVKAIVGSYIWMWTTFSEKILVWYCENRTSHASSQHMTAVCGIKTIGFLPNKDIFYGNIESDVIGIIYRKRALSHLRDPQLPSLIYPAYGCFLHAKNLYNLGKCRILANKLNPVCKKVPENSVKILRRFEQDEFGYEIIYLFLSHSSSYFKILHTTHLQNLEKAEYQVDNIEELYVFVKELRAIMKEKNVRYCELFVSAYEPEHQAVFYQLGFTPRGYIPCWKYNKGTKLFEDCILFNYYEGELAPMNLIQDGLKLLNKIQLNPN